jgi:myo-inositol 2-dehydrogenase / D-chiro-inositol 1-dehydrogenase
VERYGVEAVDTPEKLRGSGVDGVVVAAATDAHPELIVAAVEAGVPVFCEKPVARTLEEGVAVGLRNGVGPRGSGLRRDGRRGLRRDRAHPR